MVRVSDYCLRGPGFDTHESQTLFRIFDGCHDSTHDMSDFKRDCISLLVGCKTPIKKLTFYDCVKTGSPLCLHRLRRMQKTGENE